MYRNINLISNGVKRLIPALLLTGITSMISQIVLVRELLVLFYGNELSIGIILANWLWWTSCGSWLGGKASSKIKQPITAVAISEIFLAFLFILTILGVRGVKTVLPTAHGEILGLMPIWLWSFILLSGLCIINGFLFVVGCNSYKNLCKKEPESALSIGKVYIFEALGASSGGIICSLILLNYFSSLEIAWGIALINLIIAATIWPLTQPLRAGAGLTGRRNPWIIYVGAFLTFVLGVTGNLQALHIESRKWQWPGSSIITSRDSIYGNITITKHNSHHNFYENGLLSYSIPDICSSEWSTHLAILQHPAPHRVLLIGGGISGTLDEILKYPTIESIDYTELDPLVIELAESILPEKELIVLKDPRVNIHYIDGRRFLKISKDQYDVIIVNLPDPHTAQLNRFYTLEFFLEAAEHLTPYGVIYLGVTSAENYISPSLGEFLRCIYYTLKEVYPEIKVIPGEYNYFIGVNTKGYATDDHKLLEERLRNRKVNTRYVKDYYLRYRLSKERLEYLHNQLSLKKAPFLNTDFHPICYYYDITFWSTYFNTTFKKVFTFMAKMKLWHFLAPVILASIWWFYPALFTKRVGFRPRRNRGTSYVLLPIMASGFSEISFQVVTLLAFQVIYGYVYYKLGLILTSFMIGLALGAHLINRIMPTVKNDYSLFLKTQFAITLYPLLLPIVFYTFAKIPNLSFLGENIVFPLLPIVAGFVGGFQFPLGNKIYLSGGKELGKVAGLTYGIDLFGACLGALFISAFVLPILGITQTCLVTALINLSVLIVILSPVRD